MRVSASPLARVLFVFIGGIILPTGFLVYLGVQSIGSENLLLRKESQERVGKTAQALQNQAQTILGDAMAPFSRLAESAGSGSGAVYTTLRDFQKTNPTVAMLLWIDAKNRLMFPIRESRDPTLPPAPLSADFQTRLQNAETMEFKNRDYAAAFKIYRSLENETPSPHWKAVFLTSMAGCQVKLSQNDEAENYYQEILTRYAFERDAQGYPLGLVIGSQLGELQQTKGRPDLASTIQLRVFQDLLNGRWSLSWEEVQFFAHHLTDRLNALKDSMSGADRSRLAALQLQWDELQRTAAEAQNFMKQRWPVFQKTLREQNRSGIPYLLFEKKTFAYIPSYVREGDLQGALIAEEVGNDWLEKLKQTLDPISSASNLAYRLKLEPNVLLAKSDQDPSSKRWPIELSLSQTYPPIHLEVAPLNDVPVEHAAARRRQVYLGMVALAALVILIALYATWYAVSREVEVAQLKARFVASMSHELKTPLSIIGFIGQKLQLGRYESQEEIQDYYAMIAEETGRLKSLIDEVLDFSRLMENRQPYRKEPTDLSTLVQETVDRFRHSLKSETVSLNCLCESAPCMASVDREAISRVLLNLLDNAVKYSPPDRTRINVTLKKQGPDAMIQVQDEGFGIATEEKKLVFDRFYRGRSASDHRQTNGAGLGLSIVEHILAAHQSRIELQSVPGKGSIFSVWIPLIKTNG